MLIFTLKDKGKVNQEGAIDSLKKKENKINKTKQNKTKQENETSRTVLKIFKLGGRRNYQQDF